MKLKKLVWWLPLVALLIGCGGKPTAQELAEIDSLLWAEKNDSAYQIISSYDAASFKKEADRAYYNLLMTHAAVVSYHWPASDSLINEAIRYYKRTGDKERLTDSGRRSTIAYAYSEIAQAFAFMEQADSAAYYTDQMIPYLDDLIKSSGENFDPIFLSNIGYNYMSVGRYEEAEDYLAQSLKIKETAVAYEYLAWIYNKKGDDEQANLLRLKANAINDNWPKHKILYELLKYDIEHHNLEGAQEKLKGMMTISDSLHKAQMDRTILEYQHQFDEQAAQEAHRRWQTWAGTALGSLLFIIVLLKIRELVEQESPRLVRGKLLYDEIRKDGTTSGWSNDDYKCFIDYYKAIDFRAYNRIQKKYQPKTAHNTFFLILYEMGMDDKDVRRIMGVTQEAIRSTRYRIQQNGRK